MIEKLQILTYDRHSCPLSSEGSLACQTYCETGHPFIMVISEDPWHSHLMQSVKRWNCHYLFLRLRSVAAGIRTTDLPLAVSIVKPNNLHTSPIRGTVQSYTSAFSYLCLPGRTRLHGKRAFLCKETLYLVASLAPFF